MTEEERRDRFSWITNAMSSVDGFNEFVESAGETLTDGNKVIGCFREWKRTHGGINADDELTLRICQEKFDELRVSEPKSVLSGYDRSLCIEDSLAKEFAEDMAKRVYISICKPDFEFKPVYRKYYIGYNEKIAVYKIRDDGFIEKYGKSDHPYVNAVMAEMIDNAGRYDIGFAHLYKVLKCSTSWPNPYWNTPLGVYGCTKGLWELQYLLRRGRWQNIEEEFSGFAIKVLELLYLFLSRSIHIIEDSYASIQYLTNRGTLLYDAKEVFTGILADNGLFGADIGPQFVYDKYMAYELGDSKKMYGEVLKQERLDAIKMYRYGDIATMNRELGDEHGWSFGEMYWQGYLRNCTLERALYDRYKSGDFFLTPKQVERILVILNKEYPNRPNRYKVEDL